MLNPTANSASDIDVYTHTITYTAVNAHKSMLSCCQHIPVSLSGYFL